MHHRASRIAWRPASGTGHEDVTLAVDDDGCVADGHICAREPAAFEVYYRIVTDPDWSTRSVTVVEASSKRSVDLHRDAHGTWTSDDGEPLAELEGALDVDLSATPFSNTLAIRRLDLAVGESAEIVTAYVDVPSLEVLADPQRYTRLSEEVYRYESLDSPFAADIVVDELGLVREYPGLFTRAEGVH
ncbi:MAG: putative glycolipid-binding domain-containing protein [Herbiconiux sp.]|nr:putative glycolipid-binding domain-containing protein [Herbiconiux sp.]